ncbi:MAG TPA: FlgD immunoglobulin-like domain containing protein [bacterium]|nr:FlgD immunoglobulin-like domain containing protein [bacterium]HPR87487.1 FlgD immunoglobulin-like domain containing protein [bacterium]
MKKVLRVTWIAVLLCGLAVQHAQAAKPQGVAPALRTAQTQQEVQTAGATMAKAERAFAQAIDQGLNAAAEQRRLTARIEAMQQPEILIPKFMRAWRASQRPALGPASLAKSTTAAAVTGISGKVTREGEIPEYPVSVVAFDLYGYYRGDASIDGNEGTYTLRDLPAGDYYVLTASDAYVDEIYNDQVLRLDVRDTWRLAEKVKVIDGQLTTAIDFDLRSGAEITGTVSRDDGSPVQGLTLSFVFTAKNSAVPLYSVEKGTDDGWYSIHVPLVGEFKLSVEVAESGDMQTWYPNHPTWETGETVTIPAFDAQLTEINFTLAPYPPGAKPGSISGSYRWSDTAQLFSVATVFLFNAADSSLASFSFGLLGSYSLSGVPAGEYILYLDDQLGNLIGGVNYLGQYYAGATTPGEAKRIVVHEGEEVVLDDIILEPGGVLSGTIKSAEGKNLDGVWVLAIDATLKELSVEPWLSNLHLFIGQADASGAYQIAGMPSGKYVIRTISDTLINQNLLNLIKISSGAHAGEVVDAWYGGGANLFSIAAATPVEVVAPRETKNINFVLEKAKWIRGRISDAGTDVGKSFYRLFALNDSSAMPYLSFGMLIHNNQMDSAGHYRLGPLPSGTYKILALAPFSGFNNYLSEMYGGARDFNSASVVTVGNTDVAGVDFKVERGATIQGFIDLPQDGGGTIRAGADLLDGFPVVVYEAVSGKLASLDFVQFNGGYRVDHLLPGTYKILALPAVAPYAATWYSGGGTFDTAGRTVTVGYGETVQCDITLEKGNGAIAGNVSDFATTLPLSRALVIAYDATGHPAGLSMSDMDLATGAVISQTGQYAISGLRPGDYYLRTYAISSVLGLADQLLGVYNTLAPSDGSEIDYMGLLFGSGLGDLTSLFDLQMTVYADQWYAAAPARLELDVNAFALQLLAYGVPSGYDQALLPIYLPMPMAETIPATAAPVQVAEGAIVSGIDFHLSEGALSDVIADVEEKPAALPEHFAVHPNYPNPFNPTTTLAFDLPAAGAVQVVIYNGLGRQVRVLQDGLLQAGQHRLQWDGRSDRGEMAPSGLYFACFRSGGSQRTIKMVMLK